MGLLRGPEEFFFTFLIPHGVPSSNLLSKSVVLVRCTSRCLKVSRLSLCYWLWCYLLPVVTNQRLPLPLPVQRPILLPSLMRPIRPSLCPSNLDVLPAWLPSVKTFSPS